MSFLKKLFGTHSEREAKKFLPIVGEINRIFSKLSTKTDEELVQRTAEMKQSVISAIAAAEQNTQGMNLSTEERKKILFKTEQDELDEILPEAFAMVKETCRRLCGQSWRVVGQETAWDMIPYDVQLIGAIALHKGNVAEMKTGEGKTLVATMPLFLNALTGRGVHLITVNDYLAQRDAEWMGEIYKRLGLTVGYILNSMDNRARQLAYQCDITYGTNNEFGFDYLRDNMSLSAQDLVQRGHTFAIVDEVDSVLIDEARTPLIISGAVDVPQDNTSKDMKPLVQNLVRKQQILVTDLIKDAEKLLTEEKDKDAGLKLLQASRGIPKHKALLKIFREKGMQSLAQSTESEYMRDKKMHEVDEDLYFSIDEKTHVIDITEKGRETLSPDNPEMFVIPDLGEMLQDIDENQSMNSMQKQQEKENAHQLHAKRSATIHTISQLLRAFTLYEKDVEYVVQDGQVLIVDEFTGRILTGRRYSDGLHQAIEAKENVEVKRETQTLATITIQNYFRMYHKLSGMTGTAETEAEELASIYNLNVFMVPTHLPVVRSDKDDLVYKTKREKYNAVIDEIAEAFHKGQPTLVGTISVETSELLSRMLNRKGIPHNVLNAKQHQREAEIVVRAGQPGAVTIATNMAGRGTDIKLGAGVKEKGGLYIIGTERHESRRIDDQLRGRSGRQGDPGSSLFFMSLEDDLMRLFNSERVASIMDRMGVEEGEVITHRMVTRAISNAQKKVEQRNFGIRKHLLEYDDVMNQQRQVIYDLRNQALRGENLRDYTIGLISDFIDDEFDNQSNENPADWDWEHLKHIMSSTILVDLKESTFNFENQNVVDELHKKIMADAETVYRARESLVPEEIMRGFERFVILRTIDEKWKDHLYAMDQLREGINLRAYGQKNPLLEYKTEGFQMFKEMMTETNKLSLQRLFRTQLQGVEKQTTVKAPSQHRNIQLRHQETTGMGMNSLSGGVKTNEVKPPARNREPVHADKKLGRNEKVRMTGPNGEVVEIKHKKMQEFLNKGYTITS